MYSCSLLLTSHVAGLYASKLDHPPKIVKLLKLLRSSVYQLLYSSMEHLLVYKKRTLLKRNGYEWDWSELQRTKLMTLAVKLYSTST